MEVGPAFELHTKSIVFSKEALACLPIGQAFREQYQKYGQIFAYQAFPVGSLPKVLTKNEPDNMTTADASDAAHANNMGPSLQSRFLTASSSTHFACEAGSAAASAAMVRAFVGAHPSRCVLPLRGRLDTFSEVEETISKQRLLGTEKEAALPAAAAATAAAPRYRLGLPRDRGGSF